MKKKGEEKKGEENKGRRAEPRFSKEQLLSSAKYRGKKDLVSALLDGSKTYTIAEVDQMVDRFMKGKVK